MLQLLLLLSPSERDRTLGLNTTTTNTMLLLLLVVILFSSMLMVMAASCSTSLVTFPRLKVPSLLPLFVRGRVTSIVCRWWQRGHCIVGVRCNRRL